MPIANVLECYRCEAPLVAEIKDDKTVVKCEGCGALNGPGVKKEFWEPLYVSEQQLKIGSTLMFFEFAMKIEPDKIFAAGDDFFTMLQLCLQKTLTADQLKLIVTKGMEIGRLADSIDQFIKSGGFFTITKKEMEDADKAANDVRENKMPGE